MSEGPGKTSADVHLIMLQLYQSGFVTINTTSKQNLPSPSASARSLNQTVCTFSSGFVRHCCIQFAVTGQSMCCSTLAVALLVVFISNSGWKRKSVCCSNRHFFLFQVKFLDGAQSDLFYFLFSQV